MLLNHPSPPLAPIEGAVRLQAWRSHWRCRSVQKYDGDGQEKGIELPLYPNPLYCF